MSLPEAKPFRWSFLLTLPIVVAAIWAVLLALAHVQRTQLVRELSTRIANGSVNEAKTALRQMVGMPEPPLETFVSAASSPSRLVAQHAQSSISELLGKWQRQLRTGRNSGRVAERLHSLAATLDAHRDSFSTLDHPWLAKTVEQIVRLANTAPPEDALGLAIHCETLLAMTGAGHRVVPVDVLPVTSAAVEPVPDDVFIPPSRLALQSILADEEPTDDHSPESDAPPAPPKPEDTRPATPLRWSRPETSESTDAPLPQSFYRRHRAAVESASPIAAADQARRAANQVDPWENIDSRTLLARWVDANGGAKRQIERELERRGFGDLRTDLTRVALSDETRGRVQLVNDLLDTPGVGARAWLILLADDKNAEVRLAAVTVMATSTDPALVEKAWQIALHDRDPRIAGLAEQLRDRRGNAVRQ